MKYTLVSFFDSTNIGDLLISSSLSEKLSEYGNVRAFDYTGADFENEITELKYESKYNSNHQNNFKKKIKSILIKYKLNKFILRYINKVNKSRIKFSKFEEILAESDALIIGGGNMIFDLSAFSVSADQFDYFINEAIKLEKPVFAISLGIGPFQNKFQERKAVKSLAKCDYITFRDNKSYEIFRTHYPEKKNVAVSPDPVFYLPLLLDESVKKDSIGINIINPSLFSNEMNSFETIQDYIQLVNLFLQNREENIILFNTEAKDFSTCKQVYNEFVNNDRVILKKVKDYHDLFEVYSRLKVLVGTRMHSLITAYSQGIPIVGLSWQQKVDAMFELIEDSESVYNLNELNNNLEDIVNKTKKKMLNPNYEKYHVVTSKLENMNRINDKYFQSIESIG